VDEAAAAAAAAAAEAAANEAAAAAAAEGAAAASAGATEEEAAAAAAAAAAAKKPPVDWRERRIAQLTAALHEARGTAKPAAGTEIAPTPAAVSAPPGVDPAEFERRVAAEAAARAELAEFNRQCNDVAAAGRSTFGETEFNGRVAELTKLVNGTDVGEVQKYNQFLSAAIETGEAPKLLHVLGGDLNEAARIMALSPVKMAVELTKLAAKTQGGGAAPGADNALSNVPKPISPVGNRNASAADISPDDPARADALPIDIWMAKREAAAEARAKRQLN